MATDRGGEVTDDMLDNIDELKERLSSMKRMMEERKGSKRGNDFYKGQSGSLRGASIINGNFLSIVFGGSLVVIFSVSIYAFWKLYSAVMLKFAPVHTEL